MDIEIFTLLKGQVVEVFTFLLAMREFAMGKGLQNDVDRIDSAIVENKYILLLVNNQLSDLMKPEVSTRIGLFDPI